MVPHRQATVKPSAPFVKYNATWNTRDAVFIEMECIRSGGRWISPSTGETCGQGELQHYLNLSRLLWPKDYDTKWTRLIFSEFVKGGIIGIAGPSSSGKTNCMAKFALLLYWCFPRNSTILCCTTTREMLEMRIWGEIKRLRKLALARYPRLPGYLTDSYQSITTDEKSAEEGREFRNGLKGVACKVGDKWVGLGDFCFPAGTMVDTRTGPKPIELIRVGDLVRNAVGWGKVDGTFCRRTRSLVTIHLRDGRKITCTPEHRFLTSVGWMKAVDLGQSSYMIGGNESLQILRQGHTRSPQLQASQFLRQILHDEMAVGTYEPKDTGSEKQEVIGCIQASECGTSGMGRGFAATESGKSPHEEPGIQSQDDPKTEGNRTQTQDPRRQWDWTHTRREALALHLSRCELELFNQDVSKAWKWVSRQLQSGSGFSEVEASGRSRWYQSSNAGSPIQRFEENSIPPGDWVDRVEIQKPEDLAGNRGGNYGVEVYNLSVSGHPSYSVSNIICHNCGIKNDIVVVISDESPLMSEGFYESAGNLRSNSIKRPFTLIAAGNPKDPIDAFGKVCQPKCGWDFLEQGDKTQVWDTKESGGRCIRLVGTDSPNLDYPEGSEPFPKLIGRKYIKEIEETYGKDSWQYETWVLARFPTQVLSRRLFTRQMCEKFNAFDEPHWDEGRIVKLFAMDAAYRGVGGDRCVGGEFWIGTEQTSPRMLPDGTMVVGGEGFAILALIGKPILIPIRSDASELPEDQIADYVRNYCENRDISASNVFYDGTGRADLTAAFARTWSTQVNPIEFGGLPSDRPDPQDPNKTCQETYFNFCSELNYVLRATIQSRQFRGMTIDIVEEAEHRAWDIVGKSKVKIETKELTKERLKRSPDCLDMALCGVEGARRLGFGIKRLGAGHTNSVNKNNVLSQWRKRWQQINRSHELIAT